MTDTDELKRLAEAAIGAADPYFTLEDVADMGEFQSACTPDTILALIAERDEAVALLRESSAMHKDMHEVISGFLARIDRDSDYEAIVSGLKDAIDMSERT